MLSLKIPTFSFMVPFTKSSILISWGSKGLGLQNWDEFKTEMLGKSSAWSDDPYKKTYGTFLA